MAHAVTKPSQYTRRAYTDLPYLHAFTHTSSLLPRLADAVDGIRAIDAIWRRVLQGVTSDLADARAESVRPIVEAEVDALPLVDLLAPVDAAQVAVFNVVHAHF